MNQNQQTIECPKCHNQFNIEDVIQNRMEEEIAQRIAVAKSEMEQQAAQEREALNKQEEDLARRQREQEKQVRAKIAEREHLLRKELKTEFQNENATALQTLQEELKERTQKIQQLQDKELELEKLKRKDREREKEYEIRFEREKNHFAQQIEEQIRLQEGEKIQFKLAEKDEQLNVLRKQLDEMKRKAEQGSMQIQGEVQELAIEETLRNLFLLDNIQEVPKGCTGADSIHTVQDRNCDPIGKIIYESKRTKAFQKNWIEKLKQDQQSVGADIAVLVTEVLPEGVERIGEINGVWICDYPSMKGLALALRSSICRVGEAQKAQTNKGDKMEILYGYLTGTEFKMQIEAIVEGFSNMQEGIAKERRAMEKIWKEREKQLDKVLNNAIGFYGSVKGIAGSAVPVLPLLELAEEH
ncbi:MAG: DUF2130 domain-containing protein [Desulfuromonas sp.]|uniref:DUF2130 domain-containing protein n=1 Tax=Desulfuromonas sp. TaxID=892 RepID=UPI000CBEFEA5|nr:DUF2130 domain-containing protein [Desulfuromonas sp.]PLX85605.1 MAG: DUF2130 domain-containing protein [Desulfuromonas sp.]